MGAPPAHISTALMFAGLRRLFGLKAEMIGEPEFTDADQDTLVNPTLLVEVLSEATNNYDRGEKFERYRTLGSFAEYLLLAQNRPHCEHYVRQPDRSWILTEESRLDVTVPLTAIGCELALSEAYDKVSFGPRPV